MNERTVMVAKSFDARQVAFFVQTASKFASKIIVSADSKTVNAKSIMGIISLGIGQGQKIKITAEGDDSAKAVEEITSLLA